LSWDAFLGATYSPTDGYVHPPIVARNITAALARSASIDLGLTIMRGTASRYVSTYS
jgi:glycine/D-amino acid oxidase-like deaminating enzyme